ncbi:MAG TPA: DUF4440 domain-containing protein [Thiotrichaceae bacterium]|jgi:ketosteroid isomerase-like protein|nr:DUF4440 domain-containing protein [Thiotrichaceae bacterium]HIM09098.1 DUF4440 domain-containing protein [Gammaproteobacteria bacterium]
MKNSNKIDKALLIVCLCFLLVFNASFIHAENISGGRSVIETLNDRWNKALNSGKPESVGELYDQGAILSPGNGEFLVGRVAIEDLFRGFIDNGVHDHSIEIIGTHQDGNTMYEISKWRAYGREENGKKPVFGGVFVNIFHIDENGKWKSHLHTWNLSDNTGEQ